MFTSISPLFQSKTSLRAENSDLRRDLNLQRQANAQLDEACRAQLVRIEDLECEKSYLGNENAGLFEHSYTLKTALQSALRAMAASDIDPEQIYDAVGYSLDPEGWKLCDVAKRLTGVDVFCEFIVEDSMGRFENSDGHDLIGWMEASRFGDITYSRIGSMHEAVSSVELDTTQAEYLEYKKNLYKNTVELLTWA